ncbi:DUF4251 domain-containing protein [Flavobacterium sp. N3904]|uniref:DUF4251 domain-containing protein n=1 Tax=Flavobacterium sp. N3904 TaxID=2986835 RepID=UPI00222581ED|nr:DUF4251 domain-containing protein [Flavobacterium sp. N3904]
MKTLFLTVFLSLSIVSGFAQEKTKKQLKEEQKLAKQNEIAALLESKEFKFEANMAYPQGTRSVDLTTNPNFLKFEKDSIKSEMPFFGTAYSGVGYNSTNGGLYFKGNIQNYSSVKDDKSYVIKCSINEKTVSYNMILTVFLEGNASLTITASNRSTISYRGKIYKLKKAK